MPDRRFSLLGHTHDSGGAPEVNDLTAAVTWADIPDTNVPESAVTQHEAALTITESQISDLNHTGGFDPSANQTITGTWSFINPVTITRAVSNQDLLKFNTDRSWAFRTVGEDASNSLRLLNTSGGGKNFYIGEESRELVFQFNTTGSPFFTMRDGAELDSVKISLDGTDYNTAGTNVADWNISGFTNIIYADNTVLRLLDISDASLSSTAHPFQIGLTSGPNMCIDRNEIVARDNGVAAVLNLNVTGGDVHLGSTSTNNTSIKLGERTTAAGNSASRGQIWILDSVPCQLMYEGDTGVGLAVPFYVTAGYESARITVATTAPSSPAQGDIWFDTS